MSRIRNAAVAVIIALSILLTGAVSACAPTKVADEDQRPGLVSTARMFEDTNTYYPSGAEYVQAVYASQGIEISTDIAADSYSVGESMEGDIVIGADYVGILVDKDNGIVIGINNEGGFAQTLRLTNEDIHRVDW